MSNTPALNPMLDGIHPTIAKALQPFVAPKGYPYGGLHYATLEDAAEALRRDQVAIAQQRRQNQLLALEGWAV